MKPTKYDTFITEIVSPDAYRNGVSIWVSAEPESRTPEEAVQDPKNDGLAMGINEMVSKHGLWGWCTIRVTAIKRGDIGHAYLGGCSYQDAKDFVVRSSGYYEELVYEAMNNLKPHNR